MRLEVSTLAEGQGVPLSFGHAYLAVLVCVSGRARFALNFREVAVQRHDVLVLAEHFGRRMAAEIGRSSSAAESKRALSGAFLRTSSSPLR